MSLSPRHEAKPYDLVFKVLVVGDMLVGKTSLLLRYCDNVFDANLLSTIGVDCKTVYIDLPSDEVVKLQLWDTAGQERFKALVKSFYRGSNGVILVYDIANRGSFAHVSNWIEEIQRQTDNSVRFLLVGNKCDRKEERQVPTDEAKALANKYHIPFIETSAKENKNVQQMFKMMMDELLKNAERPPKKKNLVKPKGDVGDAATKSCCQ